MPLQLLSREIYFSGVFHFGIIVIVSTKTHYSNPLGVFFWLLELLIQEIDLARSALMHEYFSP